MSAYTPYLNYHNKDIFTLIIVANVMRCMTIYTNVLFVSTFNTTWLQSNIQYSVNVIVIYCSSKKQSEWKQEDTDTHCTSDNRGRGWRFSTRNEARIKSRQLNSQNIYIIPKWRQQDTTPGPTLTPKKEERKQRKAGDVVGLQYRYITYRKLVPAS
jgi:hypothetical protein